jgi:hypothetical protein
MTNSANRLPVVFGLAHFVDATLLRRGYWAPRHNSANPAAVGEAQL